MHARVCIGLSTTVCASRLPSGTRPLSGLLQAVESLEFGGDTLTTLVPDLASLKTKLPAELLDEDSLLESQPEHLSELREEVKELLIAKLIQHGGEA